MVFYKARDKIRKLKFEERKESEDFPVNLAGLVSGFPVRSVTSNLNCQFGSLWDHDKNRNKQTKNHFWICILENFQNGFTKERR